MDSKTALSGIAGCSTTSPKVERTKELGGGGGQVGGWHFRPQRQQQQQHQQQRFDDREGGCSSDEEELLLLDDGRRKLLKKPESFLQKLVIKVRRRLLQLSLQLLPQLLPLLNSHQSFNLMITFPLIMVTSCTMIYNSKSHVFLSLAPKSVIQLPN